jgi:TrpR family transcriptional regulator, trp operon repressor
MAESGWELEELIATLFKMDTSEKMKNFLEGILTSKELVEIPTRLQIVKKLKSGVPQHQIAEELGIGIATVTRGSKEIQKDKFKYV